MGGTGRKDNQGGGDSTMNDSGNPSTSDRSRSINQMLVAPWPEWNDSDINAEKWDSGFKSILQHEMTQLITEIGFENPLERQCMPASLPVHEWKRALSINPRFKVLPEDVNVPDLDLVSSNGHILHSELTKHLVASITNLHHLAAMKPFEEMSGDKFVSNGGGIWKPWNHVYAMCKVGKGTTHKPMVNMFGKYIVRLFFLGQWRRITVDDYLPLDEFGRILLPTTSRNELWPLLISKAIMCIAALTWTPKNEVLEMNAISCFTGWFVLHVECNRVTAKDVWLVCQKALMNEAEEGARYKEEPKAVNVYQQGTAMGGGDRKDPLSFAAFNELEEGWGSVAVFGEMASIDGDLEEEVEEIGPCVNHQVLISEARIIKNGDDGGPLPLWKTFRWKKWALQKGIIQPEHLVNVKSLRLFAPLKKWCVPIPKTASTIFYQMKQLEEEEELKEKEIEREKGKGKGKKQTGKSSDSKSKRTESKKSGSEGTKKKNNKIINVTRENTDPWMNFNVYSKYVESLQLFFLKTSFKYCVSSNDFHSFVKEKPNKAVNKGDKKAPNTPKKASRGPAAQPQILESTTKYKKLREPDFFYMMTNTPTAKKVFLTVGVVNPNNIAKQNAILNQAIEEKEGVYSFAVRAGNYKSGFVNWSGAGRLDFSIVGTTTRLMELEDGIVGVAFMVDLPDTHFFQITSQTEFKVGPYEIAHDAFAGPSLSLAKYGSRIFNAFAALKKCELGSPEHATAVAEYHAAFLPDSIASYLTASKKLGRFTTSMRDTCEHACTSLLFTRLQQDFEQFYSALKELQALMVAPSYGIEALRTISPEFHELTILREEALLRPPDEINLELQEQDDGGAAKEIVKKGDKKAKGKEKGEKKEKGGKKEKGEKKSKGDAKDKGKNKTGSKTESKKTSKVGQMSIKGVKSEPPHILFENQESSGNTLLLKIVEEQPDWLKYYPFRDDINQRIYCQDYSGTAATSPHGDWFPLVRLVVNLTRNESGFNGIFLTNSAALSFIQIVDNDTQKEMKQGLRNISFNYFTRNINGYTILAYGFCDNVKIKEHDWKLHLLAPITGEMLQCYPGLNPETGIYIPKPPQALKVKHVYGHYIPNRRNNVLRCILTVSCSQILTIRLSMNNPKADITVKISHDVDENGSSELIYEKTFTGRVILPSMPFLVEGTNENDEDNASAVFLIEAELARDEGWELTDEEQGLVTAIKEKVQQDLLVFTKTDSQKTVFASLSAKSLSSIKDLPKSQEIIPNASYWCVQVVVDAELEQNVSLELNTRKAQQLRKLKEAWEAADPGRFVRAMAARQEILAQRDEENKLLGCGRGKLFQSPSLKEALFGSDQQDDVQVVTEDYGDEQQGKRCQERVEFDLNYNKLLEKTAQMCRQQKETKILLDNYILSKEEGSRALLESGYKMREACLMKPSAKVEAKGKKEKKKPKKK